MIRPGAAQTLAAPARCKADRPCIRTVQDIPIGSIQQETPPRPNMGSDIWVGLRMGDTYSKCPSNNGEILDYQSVGVYGNTLFLPPYAEPHLIANISWRSSSNPK